MPVSRPLLAFSILAVALALGTGLAGAAADPAGSPAAAATVAPPPASTSPGPAAGVTSPAPVSPGTYTTAVKAEYVFGCMEANGQTPEMLQRCACSIDVVASELPYDTYETAETVMRMTGVPGQQAAVVRSVPSMKDAVEALRRAQADANQRCF